MKLRMKREALLKLNRQANEQDRSIDTWQAEPEGVFLNTVLIQFSPKEKGEKREMARFGKKAGKWVLKLKRPANVGA